MTNTKIANEIAAIRNAVRTTTNDRVAIDALSKAGEYAVKGAESIRDRWLETALRRLEEIA